MKKRNNYTEPIVLIVAAALFSWSCYTLFQQPKTRQKPALTYEEEVRVVFDKYQPLLRHRDTIEREQGSKAAQEYYRTYIADPMIDDMNRLKKKHGKTFMLEKPDGSKRDGTGTGTGP